MPTPTTSAPHGYPLFQRRDESDHVSSKVFVGRVFLHMDHGLREDFTVKVDNGSAQLSRFEVGDRSKQAFLCLLRKIFRAAAPGIAVLVFRSDKIVLEQLFDRQRDAGRSDSMSFRSVFWLTCADALISPKMKAFSASLDRFLLRVKNHGKALVLVRFSITVLLAPRYRSWPTSIFA